MSRVENLLGRARQLSEQLLNSPVLQGATPAELDLTFALLLLSSLETTVQHVAVPPPAAWSNLMAALEHFQQEMLTMAARVEEIVH